MGHSTKPYRELRALMDRHGFRLLNIARDGRERWVGLHWTEDHPLVLRPQIPTHTAVAVQRQILKSAGIETVDRARKRHPQAIKDRRAAERARAAADEERLNAEREALATARTGAVEGVTAVLTRRTTRQLVAETQTPATRGERRAQARAAQRARELAELDRVMREAPRGA